MRLLRAIVFFLLGLLVVLLLIGLFTERSYDVEQSCRVGRSHEEVFDYLKYLKNQDQYSTWMKMDPNVEKTYSGTDGTVGFVSSWNSSNPDVGSGEQEIINIEEGKRIDYELRFIEPFESVSPAYIAVEPIGNDSTEVKWGFSSEMKYPMNLMLLFFDMETMVGNDLQEGLDNLKAILEE